MPGDISITLVPELRASLRLGAEVAAAIGLG
jgi:hypothetical protein